MRRRTSAQGWTRAAIAAVMAYAFVLQALLLSASGAVHAATMAEPQGIICLQDGSSAPEHTPAKDHANLCCTVSCHGSGAAGPAPATVALKRIAPLAVASSRAANSPRLSLTSNVLPLGSRAPPRLG
ncbi:hypothetical protein [Microvirga arabica]|uniref:hypothetical protein n=1 Tax=Microvirga arabica TaxID=1128671 RepID=UPI00193AC79C|nr:hypothetical protein [Microvirga arabica]MBM1174632.1 hypothetical protein [Microvirga arabica]